MSSRRLVATELAALVHDMQQRQDPDFDTVLTELSDSAVKSVPGADYAAITVVDRDAGVRTAAATHPYARQVDEIQLRHHDGPCLAAAWEHHTVYVADLATDERWPHYSQEAIATTPIRSVLSFQVFVDDHEMGALNFYADHAHAFTDESREVGLIYATHTAIAWGLLRRDEQFRSALASRDLIGQAKGVIMERFNVDAVHAFELLKRLSQDSNIRLVEIARRLIEAQDHSE